MFHAPRKLTIWLIALALLGICGLRLLLDARYETAIVTNVEQKKEAPPHWSFISPDATMVKGKESTGEFIDLMIGNKLEEHGMQIGERADKLTLLRRVTFDLTGLPPTIQEQEQFLADQSTDAYEKVVDRLLRSERFGEHLAQDWLDLVRYADTDGSKRDNIRVDAYKYRNYVIQSLNNDLPYDRFVRQQIAGDELEPENPDALIATGFLRLGSDDPECVDLDKRSTEFLDEVTEVVGKVFLGLTIACARCHDHKFDPISQKEYYQFRALFAGVVPRDDLPAVNFAQINEYLRRLHAWESATARIQDQINSLVTPYLQQVREEIVSRYPPVIQAIVRKRLDHRTPREQQLALLVEKQVSAESESHLNEKLPPEKQRQYRELQGALNGIAPKRPDPLPTVMGVGEVGREAPPTILPEGDRRLNKEPVEPAFPKVLGNTDLDLQLESGVASSGRRSALARWLTRADHPLTARVIVNRIWQHHFGVGLVKTPNDFGKQAEAPVHLSLLDRLAGELIQNGWTLKHIHRLIVTSKTYCQSSSADAARTHPKILEVDPDNRLLWHARRRRLKAEEIRDAMLAVSGELSLRSLSITNKRGLADDHSRQESVHLPRTIYLPVKRNNPDLFLELFDRPDRCDSCPERTNTTSACQALAMLNGDFTLQRAHSWASSLIQRFGANSRDLVIQAFREAWGRPPGAEEIALGIKFLNMQGQGLRTNHSTADFESTGVGRGLGNSDAKSRVAQFCLALLNSNEFLYVD